MDVTSLPRALGETLRRARRERGLTMRDVGRLSRGRFKPSALGAYERGERSISLEKFCELGRLYAVLPDRLLADALALRDPDTRRGVVVDLNRLPLIDRQIRREVWRFVDDIRDMRGEHEHQVVSLRSGDVEALAMSSGEDPSSLLLKLRPSIAEGAASSIRDPGRSA